MAAFLANSPELACTSTFKSPLRNLRPETCERACTEEMYADAQVRVAQWRKDLVSSASLEAQQGIRELRHEREHLKDLQTDLAGVQGLVEAASQLQAGGARLAEVVHSSSEAAGARAQAVAQVCDDLHDLRARRAQELHVEESSIAERQLAADSHHAEALKLLSTYSDRLGFTITRVAPQTVRMAFSLLDECNPEREFSFILGLDDSNGVGVETRQGKNSDAYCVKECVPHVPELSQLIKELNADAGSVTALPRFVCSMRRAFLKLPGASPAA